jgi:hypothetical protein
VGGDVPKVLTRPEGWWRSRGASSSSRGRARRGAQHVTGLPAVGQSFFFRVLSANHSWPRPRSFRVRNQETSPARVHSMLSKRAIAIRSSRALTPSRRSSKRPTLQRRGSELADQDDDCGAPS